MYGAYSKACSYIRESRRDDSQTSPQLPSVAMGWFGSRPIQGSRTHRSFTQLDLLRCPKCMELTPRLVVIYESPEGTTPKLAHSSLRSQWAGLEVALYRAPERIEALLN